MIGVKKGNHSILQLKSFEVVFRKTQLLSYKSSTYEDLVVVGYQQVRCQHVRHHQVSQQVRLSSSMMDSANQSSSGASLDPRKARRVPGIRGKKPRLLDPQGFVMMYIQTDLAKKFFKCQECAEGCEVRVPLEWERRPP